MNTIKALRLLSRPAVTLARPVVPFTRSSSTGHGEKKLPSPSAAFKARQEHFQLDNGIPVYLKGGRMDMFLYIVTMGLCVVGVAKVLHVIYIFSFPRKPKEA